MHDFETLPNEIGNVLAASARRLGVDGVAIALVGPGGRRAVFTAGHAHAGSGHMVSPNTWFSIGSIGKSFTAMAVLKLAQSGRLDIEQPIGPILKDLPPAWAMRSAASLLHHTSGLPEYLSRSVPSGVPTTRADFIAAYGDMAPAFDAGRAWMYTNTNYILLGFLIAECAQSSYTQAVQGHLIGPTSCTGVAVAGPDWARAMNALDMPGAPAAAGQCDPSLVAREVIGDGDVAMTASGAINWLETLLGDRILDAARASQMLAPAPLFSGRVAPYGCGWFIDRIGGRDAHFHGGHFDGWSAMCHVVPSLGCGVMVMTNVALGHTRAQRHLAQAALEAWMPGSTVLALAPLADDAPDLTATARSQLLRRSEAPDLALFADELQVVFGYRDPVRAIPNLWAGIEPERFELVERQIQPGGVMRRYRLSYADRIEHLSIGTTPEKTIYWAWPM